MSPREWTRFVFDVLHLLVLGVLYVLGLTVLTVFAAVKRAWRAVRDEGNEEAAGGTSLDSRTE